LPFGPIRVDLDDAFLRATAVAAFLGLALFFAWQARVLSWPAVKEYFAAPADAPHWWVVIVLASMILSVANAVPQVALNHWLRKIELSEATIEAFDVASGQQLDPSIVSTGSREPGQTFPQMFLRNVPGSRPSVDVIWVDAKPIEVGVSASGYETQTIRLDRENRSRPLQVKLTRSKP
jgi:hypothetical protein